MMKSQKIIIKKKIKRTQQMKVLGQNFLIHIKIFRDSEENIKKKEKEKEKRKRKKKII